VRLWDAATGAAFQTLEYTYVPQEKEVPKKKIVRKIVRKKVIRKVKKQERSVINVPLKEKGLGDV
jgi:hypothetical protein